jgi:hypothetical protein
MRSGRIEQQEQAPRRQPSGAPTFVIELACVAGVLLATFLLYGPPQLMARILAWLPA